MQENIISSCYDFHCEAQLIKQWLYHFSVSSREREVILSWAFREIHTSLSCEYQNKINQGSTIKIFQFQFYFFNFHSKILNISNPWHCVSGWGPAALSFPLAPCSLYFWSSFDRSQYTSDLPCIMAHDILLWWLRLEMGRIILQHKSNLTIIHHCNTLTRFLKVICCW